MTHDSTPIEELNSVGELNVESSRSRLIAACEPGWESAVAGEISRRFPSATTRELAPGWVSAKIPISEIDGSTAPRVIAFARQVLPDAIEIQAPSISKIAASIASEVGRALDGHPGAWRWSIFNNQLSQPEIKTANSGRGIESSQRSPKKSAPRTAPLVGTRRGELIQASMFEQLERRYRRLARRVQLEPRAGFAVDEAFVQVALVSSERAFLSILKPQELAAWRHAVSSWPGGDLEVPQDRLAPSRACQKLYEAELRWGRPIKRGETCVDLGSSPGGWAWVAWQRGALVTAVDRSPLREDLMDEPRVTFVQGDAFKFEPPRCVDWLFSDVIAYPQRIFELLQRWLEQRWCRRFCVTIKFQQREDDAILTDFAAMLAVQTRSFELRRLKVNKNEVTAYGESLADDAANE